VSIFVFLVSGDVGFLSDFKVQFHVYCVLVKSMMRFWRKLH